MDADRDARMSGREGEPAGLREAAAAELFDALADPGRLAILRHLELGEHRVRDLTEHLGLAQSTVSAHLARLREAGLVHARPVGRASVHALACAAPTAELLRAAEELIAGLGRPQEGP